LLVEAKIKVDNTHEKTVVLKGTTIVNFSEQRFQTSLDGEDSIFLQKYLW